MPLNRRLPKRGFTNIFRKQVAIINLDELEKLAGDSSEINMEDWINDGYIKKAKDGIKILGRGEISRPMTVKAHKFSESARKKILAAGGKVEEIN